MDLPLVAEDDSLFHFHLSSDRNGNPRHSLRRQDIGSHEEDPQDSVFTQMYSRINNASLKIRFYYYFSFFAKSEKFPLVRMS